MTAAIAHLLRPYLRMNRLLLLCMAALLALGVAFINSACATRTGDVRWLHVRQMTRWIPLGLLAHLLLARIPYRRQTDWSLVPYALSLVLLVLVLVPGIGTVRFGARRWLYGFQPSEFAKLALLPALGFLLGGSTLESGVRKLVLTLLAAGLPTALIVLQPDLGTALVLIPATVAMLFVSGCAPRTLAALCLTALLAAALFFGAILLPDRLPADSPARVRLERVTDRVILPHWKRRVLAFAHPERDPLGAGWNKRQSEIAVGSGGFWGKGYLNGTQNILGFLPRSVASTDFIFSVIAEEAGFAGSLLLLALYGGLFGAVGWTGWRCRDAAGRLLCVGVGALLFVHTFVNLAMTIGLVPITGLPLPLISYGGSFTISTMAMLGLVQSVALHGRSIDRPH